MRVVSAVFLFSALLVLATGCATSGTVRPTYEPTLNLDRADRDGHGFAVFTDDSRGPDPTLATFQMPQILPMAIHRSNVAFKWDGLQESVAAAATEAGWQVATESTASLYVELLQAEIGMVGRDLQRGTTANTYFVDLQATVRHGETVVARVRRSGSYSGRYVPVHFRRPSNNKLYLLYNRPSDASLVELDYSEALAVALEAILNDKRIVAAITASQTADAPEPQPGWVQPPAPPPGASDEDEDEADKPGFIEWNL